MFGQLMCAAALGVLAWWCWQRGSIITMRGDTQILRVEGRWWAAAAVAVTLAGLLLIAAGRELLRPGRLEHHRRPGRLEHHRRPGRLEHHRRPGRR